MLKKFLSALLMVVLIVTQSGAIETSAATHTHSYSSATCTSPKKCSCGATSGSALGHSYSSATCTSPAKCSRCGATSGTSLGHNYFYSYEAAHPHKGYTKCSRCGDWWYNGQTQAVSNCCQCGNHSYYTSFESAHPHKGYKKCSRCGDWWYNGQTQSVDTCCSCVGHNYSGATCTVGGTCSRCGAIGSAIAHSTYTDFEASHPHKQFVRCRNCSYRSYTGTNVESWSSAIYFEELHPHKEYQKCNVVSGCTGYRYTGTNKSSYSECTTCHVHNYSKKIVSSTHSSNGHLVTLTCSCGKETSGGYEKLDTCCSCVGHNYSGATCTVAGICTRCKATGTTLPHSTYVDYEESHPHKQFVRCRNCSYRSYTGTNAESWSSAVYFEASHPHKEYQKCNLISGCTGFRYTGTNHESWVSTDIQSLHESGKGHAEYKTCSCGETEKTGDYLPYSGIDCKKCNPDGHTHNWEYGYEAAHPHKEYQVCTSTHDGIRVWKYTGGTKLLVSCPQCPIPDLTITDITCSPSSPKVGDSVTFTAIVKNIGRGASPSGIIHGVQFFVDGNKVDGITNYTSSIPVGGTAYIYGTWINATEGQHTISANVDELYDRILELDENNNTYTSTSKINVEKVVVDPGTGNSGVLLSSDKSEFGESSDTYKILLDLNKRWVANIDNNERNRIQSVAEEARSMFREGTPLLYYQDKMVDYLYTNAVYMETIKEYYDSILTLDASTQKLNGFIELVKTGGYYDLKSKTEWQYPYATYHGNLAIKTQTNFMYFEGKLWSAESIGNLNFGYIGAALGYSEEFMCLGAGMYQIISGTSDLSWMCSYWDDPADSLNIIIGSRMYTMGYFKN